MNRICVLKNPIQHYAWGSHTAIPELLGQAATSETPQAELWMGAHPEAPSEVLVDGNWYPLPELIEKRPAEILGKRVAEKFGGNLPFLFKVLAAARPLSIQAHPNLDQAREGFARENSLRIPLVASNRNYKDSNHKPEAICALTPFWALNGFRKITDMVSILKLVNAAELSEEVTDLEARPDSDGLKRFFSIIMTMKQSRQRRVLEAAIACADKRAAEDVLFEWMLKLHAQYPGDVGVLSPILLNVVTLNPGEAMFLRPGQLHVYLEGMGIELMANSDNVLRGGLTRKHVDVPELLRILDYGEREIAILIPEERGEAERVYPSVADEFQLSVIAVTDGISYESPKNRSVEIIICTAGNASVKTVGKDETLELSSGSSIFIPAAVQKYCIAGEATLYKASVP